MQVNVKGLRYDILIAIHIFAQVNLLAILLKCRNSYSKTFFLPFSVPTQWSDWSSCPVTCGDGLQTRSRQCHDIIGNKIVPYEHCQKLYPGETSTKDCDIPSCSGKFVKRWKCNFSQV